MYLTKLSVAGQHFGPAEGYTFNNAHRCRHTPSHTQYIQPPSLLPMHFSFFLSFVDFCTLHVAIPIIVKLDPLWLWLGHPTLRERLTLKLLAEWQSKVHWLILWEQILLTFREEEEEGTWMPETFPKSHLAQFSLKYLQVKSNLILSSKTDNTITVTTLTHHSHFLKDETMLE